MNDSKHYISRITSVLEKRAYYDHETNEYKVCATDLELIAQEILAIDRWVDCKDKLPEKNEMIYLVAKSDGYAVSCAEYNDGIWYNVMYGKRITKVVTHWMPLPVPPEDK